MSLTISIVRLVLATSAASSSPPDTLLLRSFSLDTTVSFTPVDTPVTRRHAIQYSEWYHRRLIVHQIGSFTILPLFAAEWSVGQNLLQDREPPSWMLGTHQFVAGSIGVVYGVNTITGLWNLWDSRQNPAGRTRRFLHATAMLGSGAGFIWAGAVAGNARRSRADADHHRAIALTSIGLSTAGTVMMWLWKD